MAEMPPTVPPAGSDQSTQLASVDRIPLSLQQDFLREMNHDQESGPFGPRYTIVGGWRLLGELDLDTLRAALFDVVVRHEALRTCIDANDHDPHQRIHPPSPPDLQVRDLQAAEGERDQVAEAFLNEIEAGKLGIEEVPQIRAFLGRFDSRDSVLTLIAHHTAVDGWSIHQVMQDLAAYYAARRENRPAVLPKMRQYRDYVAWQHESADSDAVKAARAYWRKQLDGARMVPTRTSRPRAEVPFFTSWHRFLLGRDVHDATLALAAETRSSPFMVLLAAYLVYQREVTGQNDLVVATFTPGRQPGWVQNTVGSFYNFLPLRTDITDCKDLRDIIPLVRTTCLGAYSHEIPFEYLISEAPELLDDAITENSAGVVFQVTQSPLMMTDGEQVSDLEFVAMRRRVQSAPVGSQLPDGMLWGLELHPSGEILGSVGYTTHLFTEATVTALVADFCRVLSDNLLGRS